MKKITTIVCALIFVLLASCKTTEVKNNKPVIELKGNPTTGFTWIYEIEDDSIISIDEKQKYLGSNGIVGASNLFTFTISPLNSGITTIKFEYKRSWETAPALETKLYKIIVDDNFNVEIIE